MLDIFAFGLLLGAIIGYVIKPKNSDDWVEQYDARQEDRKKFSKELAYYKKLTKNLVEENAELRRKVNAE